MSDTTELGDPIGALVERWSPCSLPARDVVEGRYCRLEPLSATHHGDDLFAAFAEDQDGANWTHRMNGPYPVRADLDAWLSAIESKEDMIYMAYVDRASGRALGNGAYMEMAPGAGSIEIGSIMFGPSLQRTTAATEAIYLMIRTVFDLRNRRLEWTCDPLNASSMGAAERFGFSYEALFRQAYVTKWRNRDKAIFSITDKDWPAIRQAFETWLAPDNFDADGAQRQSLRALTAPYVQTRTTVKPEVEQNTLGQPIDAEVPGWVPPPRPERVTTEGRYCRLEPLHIDHAEALFAAHCRDTDGRNWTYLPNGPFETVAGYRDWVEGAAASPDPLHFTVITDDGPVGTASYLRINPDAGSIEVGYITFSPLLQRTPASTEAMYLMMRWAFDAGYRRYEWKCNALNGPSRVAAQRLGLSYEGVFRQAQITKGRNRDTAWYAAIDSEWPAIRQAMETWLASENFGPDGAQKQSLSDLTRPVLVRTG